jgi:hypothetical protein
VQVSTPTPPEQEVEPNAPEEPLPQLTVLVGVVAVPVSVSVTVAVQVVGEFTGTDEGAQTTEVEVVRVVADTLKVPFEVEWSMSPE